MIPATALNDDFNTFCNKSEGVLSLINLAYRHFHHKLVTMPKTQETVEYLILEFRQICSVHIHLAHAIMHIAMSKGAEFCRDYHNFSSLMEDCEEEELEETGNFWSQIQAAGSNGTRIWPTARSSSRNMQNLERLRTTVNHENTAIRLRSLMTSPNWQHREETFNLRLGRLVNYVASVTNGGADTMSEENAGICIHEMGSIMNVLGI